MRTAGIALTLFAALCFLFAALCFVPTVVQRIGRRRATRVAAVRRHEWADARLEAELRRVVDQRDRYMALYHEAAQRNALLLGQVEAPIEDVLTPEFDRACLAWLDKSTDWDDAS